MGTLYVVATPIGNLADMTPRAVTVLRHVALIAAEDTRHTATLLREFGIDTPMVSYHHHNRASRHDRLLAALAAGDIALVSDAGTPAIADPGHDLVRRAIEAGHTVVPVPGASSAIAAVSASGLVPGPFLFVGFLPRTGEERKVALAKAAGSGYPFVLFESPLRTGRTLVDVEAVAPGRRAMVARELTKLHEELVHGQVAELAARYADDPPRGEVVLVIGGSEEMGKAAGGVDGEAVARTILAQGVKPSRAAREVSAITGLDRAEAYELVQRLARERDS